jgi:type VI secretion system protein ImpH
MAHDARPPSGPLGSTPTAETELRALNFFQALRRLECAHRDKPRLGHAAHISEEPVRLGQEPNLAFEHASLVGFAENEEGGPAKLSVGFFGAFGPEGPLPLHVTEYAHQRMRNAQDRTLVSFVNIFHHRLLLLFYRAWADAQPVVNHDRPHDDDFAGFMAALVGQGAGEKKQALYDLDRLALYMAGHFSSEARHPEGLSKVLGHYFGVPVQVEEFVGEWLTIPESSAWKLGRRQTLEGGGKLGLGSRIGLRVYERQYKFRIVLGPLERRDYDRFLPEGDFSGKLAALVERYAGQDLAWDVRLILNQPDRVPARIGRGARLGRTTHLIRNATKSHQPFQDYIYTPPAHAD